MEGHCKFDRLLSLVISEEDLTRFVEYPIHEWKGTDVLAWGLANVRRYSLLLDVTPLDIPLLEFHKIDGSALLAMTQRQFRKMSPKLGKWLYTDLQELLQLEGNEVSYACNRIEQECHSEDEEKSSEKEEEWESESSEEELATEKRRKNCRKLILWKFLIQLLADPKKNPKIIKWVSAEEGIFKVTDTKLISEEWDSKKERRNNMTYEKLSRALRAYYKSKILLPGPKDGTTAKKLVYRFGSRARGWREAADYFIENTSSFGYPA